jgi:hypothetical protein
MSTWEELRTYARDKYRLALDEDDRFAVVFAIPGGRTQQVVITHFRAIERDFIEFRTPVCTEADLQPRAALEHNSTCSIGALALHGGVYYLVHKALLRTLDNEEFELPLHAMALHADTLEAAQTAGHDAF